MVGPTFDDATSAFESPDIHRGALRLDQFALAQAADHHRNHAPYRGLLVVPSEHKRICARSAAMGREAGSADRLRKPDPARDAGPSTVCRRVPTRFGVPYP